AAGRSDAGRRAQPAMRTFPRDACTTRLWAESGEREWLLIDRSDNRPLGGTTDELSYGGECNGSSSPQIRRAVSTTNLRFRSWSAGVMAFPITELEKPHCGLTAKRS